MSVVHAVFGGTLLALFVLAAALGSWRWWQVEPSDWFWRLLRAGQVGVVLEAAFGGVLLAAGEDADREFHLLYGLLPIAVSFVAEQLRIASAETVLEARGLPDAKAMEALGSDEQVSVVRAIVRRELGVMTVAAWVIAGLLLRAGFV